MANKKILDANDLLQELLKLEKEHGSLVGIPLYAYTEDKYPITLVDVFHDGEDSHLHSIDLNVYISN
jgi:hypothetical protein